MRALLVLLLVIPGVAAVAPLETVSVRVEPFAEPVPPENGSIATEVRAIISCTVARPAPGSSVSFHVVKKPLWATIKADPVEQRFDLSECRDGVATVRTQLIATGTPFGPAFTQEPFEVEVFVETGERGNVTAVVELGYVSVIDARGPSNMRSLEPGSSTSYGIRVSNGGNGGTRIDAVVSAHSEGISVAPIRPIFLGSQYAHGRATESSALVTVTAAPEEGRVDRRAFVNVTFRASSEDDPTLAGAVREVSLPVRIQSGKSDVPVAPIGALIVALSLGAALRRRRP